MLSCLNRCAVDDLKRFQRAKWLDFTRIVATPRHHKCPSSSNNTSTVFGTFGSRTANYLPSRDFNGGIARDYASPLSI